MLITIAKLVNQRKKKMAHNLYENTMAFNSENGQPWHMLGESVEGLLTAEQAIEKAKLDYIVKKEQLYRFIEDPCDIERVRAYATVNSHNNKVLGIVGEAYTPIQNSEAFTFFDELTGQGEAIYETAGALGDGEKVWLLAKLPTSFEPIQGDRVDQFCLLYTTHDGTLPCSVMFTDIRVVCQNTLSMALKGASRIVKIRHTTNANERLAEAGRIMKQMNEYYSQIHEKFDVFAKFIIDDKFVEEYKDLMFGKEEELADRGPARSIRLNRIEMFNGRKGNGMGVDIPGVAGTAWGLYNVMTEIADWDLPKKRDKESLFENVLFGPSAEFKQKSFDTLEEMIAVRSK